MVRSLNYFFAAVLLCLLIFGVPVDGRFVIFVGLMASFIICTWSFLWGWLTRSGAFAAIMVGSITFGLGDWPTVLALLFFFMSSVMISINQKTASKKRVQRNGRQVWANGFWVVLWLVVGMITRKPFFQLASLSAIATATADTWATELGSRRFKVPTYNAASWKPAAAGSEGGVSLAGVAASGAGSGLIGLIWLAFSYQIEWAISIFVVGSMAAFVDSIMGATLQGSSWTLGAILSKNHIKITIDNNAVNFLATGFGSLLMIILIVVLL